MQPLLPALATLIGMTVQSALGFGFAFFLVPALLLAYEPAVSVSVILSVGLAINLLMLFTEHRHRVVVKTDTLLLSIASIPGLFLGEHLLDIVPKETLQVVVGSLVLAGAFIEYEELKHLAEISVRTLTGRLAALAVGFAAGVLTTSIGLSAPVLALWFLSRHLSSDQTRDTLTAVFLWLNVAGIAVLAGSGRFALFQEHWLLVALLPMIFVGHLVGRRIFLTLRSKHYERVVTAALVAVGLWTILNGIF